MKRFISLALALVMMMSLVTINVGAKDFTDDSEITYKEAVDVLSEVGVIDGYANGDFGPDATLTRGAAAKIICNLMLGPTTASALTASTAPYSDVPADHTFAAYIAYCSQQGIISGYADGTFRPSAPLTGYAFMKMLLGALGYDADAEHYTGANWAINVAKQALSIDLDDGNDNFVGNNSVTREEACLYAFNTLKATMVEYDSKTTVEVNGATVNIDGGDSEDVENTTSTDGNIDKDGKMQFAEKYFTNLKKSNTSSDDMGRPAVEWKYKGTSIGTYVDYTDLIATYTAGVDKGDLYDLVGKSTVEDIEDKDGAYVQVYVNGEKQNNPKASDIFTKNSTSDLDNTGRGVITEVFLDDEYGKDEDETMVTIVIAQTFLLQATNDYSSSKESLNVEYVEVAGKDDNGNQKNTQPSGMPNSIDQDDFDVSGYEEDDYLIVTYSVTAKEIQSVELAEVLVGEVDSYKYNDSVTVDGTKYKYNYLTDKTETFDSGSNASLVLDPYGYVIYVDEANASGSFVYIQEFGSNSGLSKQAVASAYFTDGSDATIDVKKVTYMDNSTETTTEKDSTIADWKTTKAGWYTYSVNSSDEYTLKSVDCLSKYKTNSSSDTFKGDGNADVSVIMSETVKFLSGNNIKGNSETLFLVLDTDEDLDVYTGINNAPDVDLTAKASSNDSITVSWVADGAYADYVFIDASSLDKSQVDIDEATSSDDYLFILTNDKKAVKDGSGDDYVEVEALVEGKYETVQVNYGDEDSFVTGTLYHKLKSETSTGYLTGATKIENETNGDKLVEAKQTSTIEYESGTLNIGSKELILADDAEINLIVAGGDGNKALLDDDGADYELYLGISGRALESNLNGYTCTYDYYAILDDDGSDIVDILYVWVSASKETTPSGGNGTVTTNDQKVADAVKAIGTEMDVTVTEGTSAAVKTAVETELTNMSLSDVTTTVKVRSYTAATNGSTSEATVVITVTSTTDTTKSASATITAYVTVEAASGSTGTT